jgi:hypothetical protein
MEHHLEAQIGVGGAAMGAYEAAQEFFAVAPKKIDGLEQVVICHRTIGRFRG